MNKSYCTQNDNDCSTCSLVSYGRDCENNPILTPEQEERRAARIAAAAAVNDAPDMASEQTALKNAFVVDIRPSLPAGAVDLYHQWDTAREPDHSGDYGAVCKGIGAGYDRGARRFVIDRTKVTVAIEALKEAGFLPCVSPSLLVGD